MIGLGWGLAMAVLRGAAVAIFFLAIHPELSVADPAFSRVLEAARASPHVPESVVDQAKASCGTALCFAEMLTAKLPDLARLEAINHPDTDSIRWVRTAPSVTVVAEGERLRLKLTHFGRKAAAELRDALVGRHLPVELSLRGNGGGDFERMLEIAGVFIGPKRNAIESRHRGRRSLHDVPGTDDPMTEVARVLINEDTASAGLLLAQLLEAFAGAEVSGPPRRKGPIFLKRRVTIDHDWRLVLPVATLRVVRP